ncbi:MAG: hypothetical protein WCS51_00380 [Bacilli bacterium]
MATKKEKAVLQSILIYCNKKKSCLITYQQIIKNSILEVVPEEIDGIINNLCLDGYIDSVKSFNKDIEYLCINILPKGENFLREEFIKKRNLISRVGITIALAILSFIITLILKIIF